MQTEAEAVSFDTRMREIAELYDRDYLTKAAHRQWWLALEAFPWPAVNAALTAHTRSSSFFPRPADVIKRLVESDGRPSGDEAWSTALQAQDDHATVVWSRETRDAWTVARPVLAIGDRIGARRTFLAAYEHAVTHARQHLQPVEWSISLGCDPAGRLPAVAAAVRQGRITRAVARSLLGPGHPGTAPTASECVQVAGLLAGKGDQDLAEQTAGARRFLDAVRDGLRQADERLSREQAAREFEREIAREQAQAKKAADLKRLSSLGTGN